MKISQSQLARVMRENEQAKTVCQKKKKKESGFVSKERTIIFTENFLYSSFKKVEFWTQSVAKWWKQFIYNKKEKKKD